MARSKNPSCGQLSHPRRTRIYRRRSLRGHTQVSNGVPEKKEKTIALNMEVPVRLKNEMKAYKEYGGYQADRGSTRSGVGIL